MFHVGDKVCYPMHGVGIIEAIEDHNVLGKTSKYYVLRFILGKMTAMVPVNAAGKVGLRAIIGADECGKVIEFMQEEPRTECENWNKRYRENYEKMRGGNIYDVADVVKRLTRRDAGKGLSAGERKMLNTARQVLAAELAAASGKDPEEMLLSLKI